jgi:PAB-dependent poly(A)-specific ribonuclease subunit 3
LAGFGRLILALACGSVTNASMEFMAPHYSADLVRITQALLASSPDKTEGVGISSIRQLYAVLAERMFGEIENLHVQNDEIMNELSKETENGRLVRILVKLGMMNERPDDDMDPGWSETGDRYLLKLFRDFVFHQVLSLSLFGISKKSWLLFEGWGA